MNFANNTKIYTKVNKVNLDNVRNSLIYLYVFFSGFVFIEPSPAELVFIFYVFFLLLTKKIIKIDSILLTLTFMFILSDFTSLLRFNIIDANYILRYFVTDVYLLFVPILFLSDKGKLNADKLYLMWEVSAYINIFAILLSLKTGIISSILLKYGRFTGFFKDPNVFGPFLIPPCLYLIGKLLLLNELRKVDIVFLLIRITILFMGIIFSLSRGAWLNFAVSLVVFTVLLFGKIKTYKVLFGVFIFTILLLSFSYIALVIKVPNTDITYFDFFKERLGLMSYDKERFWAQRQGLLLFEQFPIIGSGIGTFKYIIGMDPHNQYIRALAEKGIIGFLAYIFYMGTQMLRAKKNFLHSIVAFSAIIGIMSESFVVETIHWRHLWILIFLALLNLEQNEKVQSNGGIR